MNELELHELSRHVVAWHNRHPLARRITAAQLHSVGYVVLPFLAPDGPTAAPTAPAAADRPAWQAAFSEDFIAPLAPAQVGRWALVHGAALLAPRGDAPVRQVQPHGAADTARLQRLWVLTAQIEAGAARSRVLVGAGDRPAVLGRRLWSGVRIGGLATATVLLLAGALALSLRPWAPTPAAGAVVAAPASPASPASQASPASPASQVSSASAAGPAASSAPSPAASGAADPARPLDVEPRLGRIELPPIGPRVDARNRAAEQARQGAASAPQASRAAPAGPPAAAAAVAATAVAAAASAPAGPAFAVSTRRLRTRTESEQVAAAMRALLVTPATPRMKVEVIAAGDDWRVVGWPYADRAQADKARALLAGRGMKVEVIDF